MRDRPGKILNKLGSGTAPQLARCKRFGTEGIGIVYMRSVHTNLAHAAGKRPQLLETARGLAAHGHCVGIVQV